ncbi:MAG TPA: M1 family aminopeptidase, partial [Vicinamibacterales bacterium]|nr:M1 family aminopeptidase [Vicinamibacterales bacterium]
TLDAPDLRLTMRSGAACVARSPGGVTGMVLRGRGQLRFTPPDPAEQGQLRIFAGEPEYVTDIEAAFIRMNSAEFMTRVSQKGLVTTPVDRREFERAADVFGSMAPLTFNLELDDLAPDRWSIEPTFGSMVIESRTRRHGWLTYARTPSDAEDITFFDRANNRNLSAYATPASLARRDSRFYDEDDRTAYDVLSYALDLTFDPAREWVSGRGTLRLRIKPPGVHSLTLRLASSLGVSSVSSPAFGRLLTLRISGQNNLLVGLPALVGGGSELVLDVQYGGRLAPQGLDRESLVVDQSPFQEPPQIIQTPEPRFMYSNRALWYPQAPVTDFATSTMRLTVPSEYQIVASGTPVGSSVEIVMPDEVSGEPARSMRTVEYVADRPSRYLAVVISRFVPVARTRAAVAAVAPPVASATTGPAEGAPGVDIEIVSTPRMAGRNQNLPARVEDMIRFFADTIGEAPYPDFTLAAVDDNLPGGHSPAFFAVLHQPLPSTPFQWSQDPVWFGNYPRLFLAHEVAHQWWGQAVGWKNYHEQWLSEGLAQYFAVLYAEKDRGEGLMHNLLSSMRDTAERESAQGPIYLGYRLGHIQGDSGIFRSILYNKSAVVLHMLRGLIGDEAFFGGLRRFYAEWRFRKAGTDNLRDAFQAGTPIPLDRFFERWILGASLPTIRVTSEIARDRLSAIVRIRQPGDVFDLPLPLHVQYADGETTTIIVPVTTNAIDHPITGDRPIRRITVDDSLIPGDVRG